MSETNRQTQGVDPLGHVWTSPAAFMSETEWYMGYTRSKLLAAAAAARRNLYDASVLDIGCGFGATTAAIASFGPRAITAVDKSPQMLEGLKHILISDDSIEIWLREQNASLIIDDVDRAVLTLKRAREEFKASWFSERSDSVNSFAASVLDLTALFGPDQFDAIVGNNIIAWPIGEVKQKLLQSPARVNRAAMAVESTLKPLVTVVKKGGIIALSVTKDFVVDDLNHKRDVELQFQTFVSHPLFDDFHKLLADVMYREFLLSWHTPTTETLFTVSDFIEAATKLGCETRVIPIEVAFPGSPVNAFMAQLPKIIGKLDLTGGQKIALLEKARRHVRPAIEKMMATRGEFGEPAFSENYCFILEKVSA